MRNFFITLLMLFSLVGCGSVQTKVVKETEVRYEKVPSELTEKIIPERPKTREDYLALKPHEREGYLSFYDTYLLGVIKELNIKLDKINKLNGQLK